MRTLAVVALVLAMGLFFGPWGAFWTIIAMLLAGLVFWALAGVAFAHMVRQGHYRRSR